MRKEKDAQGVPPQSGQLCPVCSLEPQCLHWDLDGAESQRLEEIVRQPPALNGGQHLFHVGDTLASLFAVRTGAFKTYAFDAQGREYVLGFSLAGELIGFDGVYSRRHGCNAVALRDSAVCVLPYIDLAELMGSIHRLREQILRLASRNFRNHAVDGDQSPEGRVARFLVDLAARTNHLPDGGRGVDLELPMTRDDIASYLHLNTETLADTFAALGDGGVISLDGSGLRLQDWASLERIADQC